MKGTCLVVRIAQQHRKVVLGRSDGRITPRAGLYLVAKVDRLLGIRATIDAGGSSFKQRRRGLMLGGVMVVLAETMLAGGDFPCDLDHQRKDVAGLGLRAVADVPASTTVIGLGKRFDETARSEVEQANAALIAKAFALVAEKRRVDLVAQRPTIDLDSTDTEVYGRKKRGSAYNYLGQRVYRPHCAIWAEAGWVLAADFGSGTSDPRPQAPALLARALSACARTQGAGVGGRSIPSSSRCSRQEQEPTRGRIRSSSPISTATSVTSRRGSVSARSSRRRSRTPSSAWPCATCPSGYEAVNAMWMWAALLGLAVSSWLQAITGHDTTDGRAHGKRLRRELVCIAARVTRHAGRIEVHAAPEDHNGCFADAWRALDALPSQDFAGALPCVAFVPVSLRPAPSA